MASSSCSRHSFRPSQAPARSNRLSGRGYSTANTLSDEGLLSLQGGTLDTSGLSIGTTGLFEGFGIVSGTVSNQGDIIANGGALYVPGWRSAVPVH